MPDPLTPEEVRHVAKLARLALPDEEVERARRDLSNILNHVAMVERLELEDVPMLSRPLPGKNRLAEDEVGPSIPLAALLKNAPAVEGPYLDVPKVLDDAEGGSA